MTPSFDDVPSFHIHFDCAHPIWVATRLQLQRCRKCGPCMRQRARQWAARAHREREAAPRCWFITLTFAAVPADPARAVTLWLKRLRKSLGGSEPIRYLFVTEHGAKHGRVHHHGLLFCRSVVTRREVEGPWELGFSKAKLAAPAHMHYVSKYITKEAGSRLRASSDFGSLWFDWDTAHIPLSGGKPAPKLKCPF